MDFNINGLIKKLNMMTNNSEKQRLYMNMQCTLSFMEDIEKINSQDIQKSYFNIIDLDTLNQKQEKEQYSLLYDLYSNTKLLNNIYKPILSNISSYPFYFEDMPYINFDRLIDAAEEFFKILSPNVYNLYVNLLKNELIFEKDNNDCSGQCTKLDNDLSGIIITKNDPNFLKILCLVHEIGHAYDYYLNKTANYNDYSLYCEVISTTFEHLFILYLESKNVIGKEAIKKIYRLFFIEYTKTINNAYIYNKLILNNQIKANSILTIDNQYTKDFIIQNSILKNNIVYQTKQIDNLINAYNFGIIMSFIFKDHYQKDAKLTIQEIEEISKLVNNLTTKEIIHLFSKNEYVNSISKDACKILCKRK